MWCCRLAVSSAQSLGAMLTEAGFGEMMDAGSRIRVREVVGGRVS